MSDSLPLTALHTIRNFVPISERIGTSGQPSEAQLALIREAGFETLINLLPVDREATNEPALVEQLGMEYVNIPVLWHNPTVANLRDFFRIMDSRTERRVFVHCQVNMRVSAFMYLYRILRWGVAPEEAEIELHDIWVPDGVWQEFIENILQDPTAVL
jgi:protein tyrosine phosphatase (PTP) superfamily phosphohydrolase (DUF442 family)